MELPMAAAMWEEGAAMEGAVEGAGMVSERRQETRGKRGVWTD